METTRVAVPAHIFDVTEQVFLLLQIIFWCCGTLPPPAACATEYNQWKHFSLATFWKISVKNITMYVMWILLEYQNNYFLDINVHKQSLCSFVKDIETKNFNIYNINEVIIKQTQKYWSFPWLNKHTVCLICDIVVRLLNKQVTDSFAFFMNTLFNLFEIAAAWMLGDNTLQRSTQLSERPVSGSCVDQSQDREGTGCCRHQTDGPNGPCGLWRQGGFILFLKIKKKIIMLKYVVINCFFII